MKYCDTCPIPSICSERRKCRYVKETAERPLDAPTCSQCIVHGCVNHRHQGRFIGDMCAPCYSYITTGKVGPTASFLSRMDVLRTIAASDWKTAGELRKMARDAISSENAEPIHGEKDA